MPEHTSNIGTRISVIGSTGSGKTTAARTLADRLGFRHIEMDALFWKPNWGETPDEEFLPAVDEATRGDRWVMDGNYSRTRPIVWPRLDTIVWLDYRFHVVFLRLLRRTVVRSISKEELWSGCEERFRNSFFSKDSILVWLFRTYWRRKRTVPRALAQPEHSHISVFHFHTPRAFRRWLRNIEPATD